MSVLNPAKQQPLSPPRRPQACIAHTRSTHLTASLLPALSVSVPTDLTCTRGRGGGRGYCSGREAAQAQRGQSHPEVAQLGRQYLEQPEAAVHGGLTCAPALSAGPAGVEGRPVLSHPRCGASAPTLPCSAALGVLVDHFRRALGGPRQTRACRARSPRGPVGCHSWPPPSSRPAPAPLLPAVMYPSSVVLESAIILRGEPLLTCLITASSPEAIK